MSWVGEEEEEEGEEEEEFLIAFQEISLFFPHSHSLTDYLWEERNIKAGA